MSPAATKATTKKTTQSNKTKQTQQANKQQCEQQQGNNSSIYGPKIRDGIVVLL